jgi:hypothetical protein
MARKLSEQERERIWERLERRLTAFDGRPEPLPRSQSVHQYDYAAYPGNFPDHLLVRTGFFPLLPDEALLTAIKEGMERLSERSLYLLAKEYAQGDEEKGLDWEISLLGLSREILEGISPGFECYLFSVTDAWAIYFHHEGFAYCGGVPPFTDAVRAHCEGLDGL